MKHRFPSLFLAALVAANPDITDQRVILLQNQSPKDAFTMIQAENYDLGDGYAAPNAASAFGIGGNEMGLYIELAPAPDAESAQILYKNVDFGEGATELHLRMTGGEGSRVRVLIDGEEVAVLENAATAGPVTYEDIEAAFPSVTGIHDLALEVSGAAIRLNWLQFA